MIFVADVGFVCNKATGQYHGQLCAKALLLHHLLRQVALQRQNHPASRAVAPVILGLPLVLCTPRFERIGWQLVRIAEGNNQGSLGNSKRFISTFVPSILLIVLVNVDQLVVIWLQNEHTQKTLSPHLLLTSPIPMHLLCLPSPLPRYLAHLPSGSRAYRAPENRYEK
ncbi:hypothetical protein ACK33S_10505 [Aeromonas hydrophila]|uniref:hypothetical protein n=1 Tax=Aeromonas hydrophila TaxID=644 RepID=UPI003985CE57